MSTGTSDTAPVAPGLRSGLWLPLFGERAEPRAVMQVAAEAEQAGWHGVFVWDQLSWREPVTHVGDPWITLAAVATATATERVRLGPMVTPLPRRRPAKVARESAALDRLSGGRAILGVGMGGDRFARELSRTGEQLDDRLRGEMLDEFAEIAAALADLRPPGRAYDLAVAPPVGTDPLPYARAGATWWLPEFSPEDVGLDTVRGVLREGPFLS